MNNAIERGAVDSFESPVRSKKMQQTLDFCCVSFFVNTQQTDGPALGFVDNFKLISKGFLGPRRNDGMFNDSHLGALLC